MDKDSNKTFKSEEILAEVKRSISEHKIIDTSEESIKVVIFSVGGNLYACYGDNVQEILQDRTVYPVPFLPEYLPGLINVRGDIESALDICFFLGGQRSNESNVLVIMVHKGTFRSGIIVDNIEDVIDIPFSSVRPPMQNLSGAVKELISGSVEFRGSTVAILDIEKLATKVSV